MRVAALLELARFDFLAQWRRESNWLCASVFFALGLLAPWLPSDFWSIAGASTPTAPINAALYLAACSALAPLLLVNASVGSLLSDRSSQMLELLRGLPFKQADYLAARWISATATGVLSTSATLIGWSLGFAMNAFGWGSPAEVASVVQEARSLASSWLLVLLPNTLFVSTLLFFTAKWVRGASGVYIGVLCTYAAWFVALPAASWAPDEYQDVLVELLDPFGGRSLALFGHARTLVTNNTELVSASSTFLLNRMAWLCVTGGCWAGRCSRRRDVGSGRARLACRRPCR